MAFVAIRRIGDEESVMGSLRFGLDNGGRAQKDGNKPGIAHRDAVG
ncbi:hypothetical protein THH46_23720 [Pseudomonas sp. NA13]